MGVREVTKVVGVWALLLFAFWVVYNIGHFHGASDENMKLAPVRCDYIRYEDNTRACIIPLNKNDINLYRER